MSDENTISRRNFIAGVATGAIGGTLASMGLYSYTESAYSRLAKVARNGQDFGAVRSVKVTAISETSWFNNAHLMEDIKKAGGLLVDQYTIGWGPFGNGKAAGKSTYDEGIAPIKKMIPNDLEAAWALQAKQSLHPDNPGGFSTLIEVEDLDGSKHKYLLDTGWSYTWMDQCFKREGIDQMLRSGEIEALIVSHEHFDHFWGLPVTMKYNNKLPMYVPNTFYKEGKQYVVDSGYKGDPKVADKEMTLVRPGMMLVKFDVPIICRVFGELSLAFNVKDKGLVVVSGCNHQGILQMTSTVYEKLKYDNDRFYGLYGGLHISPFEDWDPKYDDLVISLGKWNFEKVGCNHCTGHLTAKKFVERGYPVVRGSARFRTSSPDYLGNGDTLVFG